MRSWPPLHKSSAVSRYHATGRIASPGRCPRAYGYASEAGGEARRTCVSGVVRSIIFGAVKSYVRCEKEEMFTAPAYDEYRGCRFFVY